MKPTTTIILALLGSALISAVMVMVMTPSAPTDSLASSASDQLALIQRRLDLIDEDMQAIRQEMLTADDMRTSQGDFLRREALQGIEDQLLALRKQKSTDLTPGDSNSEDRPSEDSIAAVVDERIRLAEEALRNQKKTRRNQAASKWAREGAIKRTQSLAKRLSLNTDQAERLTAVFEVQSEATMPLWGTLKNEEASAQDRLSAIESMRNSSSEVLDQARSIMSSQQFEEFEQEQEREGAKTNSWIRSVEESIRNPTK